LLSRPYFWFQSDGSPADISANHAPIVDIPKIFKFVFCFIVKNVMCFMPYLFSRTSKIRIYELKYFKLQQFQYIAMVFN